MKKIHIILLFAVLFSFLSCKNNFFENFKENEKTEQKQYVTIGFSIPENDENADLVTPSSRSIKPIKEDRKSLYADKYFDFKLKEKDSEEYLVDEEMTYTYLMSFSKKLEMNKKYEYSVTIYENDSKEILIDSINRNFTAAESTIIPIVFDYGYLDISFLYKDTNTLGFDYDFPYINIGGINIGYDDEQIWVLGREQFPDENALHVLVDETYTEEDPNYKPDYKRYIFKGPVKVPVDDWGEQTYGMRKVYINLNQVKVVDIEEAQIRGGLVSRKYNILAYQKDSDTPDLPKVTINFDLGMYKDFNSSFSALEVEVNTAYGDTFDGVDKTLLQTIQGKVPDSPVAVFAGWYTDKNLTKPFNPDRAECVSSDFTLYANYIVPRFYDDKGNYIEDYLVQTDGYGYKILGLHPDDPAEIVIDGYGHKKVFAGWYWDPEYTEELSRTIGGDGNREGQRFNYWTVSDSASLENPIYARYIPVDTYHFNKDTKQFEIDEDYVNEWDLEFYEGSIRINNNVSNGDEYFVGYFEDAECSEEIKKKTDTLNWTTEYWLSSTSVDDLTEPFSIYLVEVPNTLNVVYHFDSSISENPDFASFDYTLEKEIIDYSKGQWDDYASFKIPVIPESLCPENKLFMGWSLSENYDDILYHGYDYDSSISDFIYYYKISLFNQKALNAILKSEVYGRIDLYPIFKNPIQVRLHDTAEEDSAYTIHSESIDSYELMGSNLLELPAIDESKIPAGKVFINWYVYSYDDYDGNYKDYATISTSQNDATGATDTTYEITLYSNHYAGEYLDVYPRFEDIVKINYPANLLATNPELPCEYLVPNIGLEIPTPTDTEKLFCGWYSDPDLTTEADLVLVDNKFYFTLDEKDYKGQSYNLYPKWIDYSGESEFVLFNNNNPSSPEFRITSFHDNREPILITGNKQVVDFANYDGKNYFLILQWPDPSSNDPDIIYITDDINFDIDNVTSTDPVDVAQLYYYEETTSIDSLWPNEIDLYVSKNYIYFATIFKPYVTAEVVKIEKANCNFEKYTVNLEKYDNPSDRIEDFTFFANDNYLGFTLYFYRSSYGWVTTRNYYNIFEIKPNDEEELELVLNEQLTQELNGFLTDKISEEYKGDPEYQKFEIIDSMIDKDNNIYSLFAGAEATVLYCGSFVKFTFDGTDYTSYTNYYHSTNAIDFHSDDSMRTIYGPESKYSNLLFGPQKFLLVSEEPKKLVIADDGTFFFTRGGDIYFSNINRVVFVNLEENVSVEAVTLVEDEFENYIGYDSYDISCRSYLNAKKLISRSND